MVAGGTLPRAYWTCDGESDAALESRKRSIPDCGDGGEIKLHVFFPSCWDGKNLDSSDHRRHVVYGLDADGHAADIEAERRPSTHPVKLPELDIVQYDVEDSRSTKLSDGTRHAARRFLQRLGGLGPGAIACAVAWDGPEGRVA